MRTTKTLLAASVGAIAALALAGCSGGPGGGGDELDYEDSPLNQYMSSSADLEKSPEDWEKESEANNKKVEELVAACMKEEGFKYTPNVDQGGTVIMSGGEDDMWKPDDREWVSQYGYGMINYPGQEEMMNPSDGEEYTDPNQDYVQSLSESEQKAYQETLWGPQPTEEEMNDPEFEWEYDPENAGCYGTAQEEIWGGMGVSGDDEFKPLMDALDEFYSAQYSEEGEPMKIDAKWSSCMADAGHPDLKRQFDAQNSFSEEINKFYEGLDPEDMQDPNFDPSKDPAMQELQKEEITMALADLDCREKVDYRQEQLKEQFALEEQFIKEHKAELEAYKAAMEQGKN